MYQQLKAFFQDGYLIKHDVFSKEELQPVVKAIEAQVRQRNDDVIIYTYLPTYIRTYLPTYYMLLHTSYFISIYVYIYI